MIIYDSNTRKMVDFISILSEDGLKEEVGIYVCGPTVQSTPHIGHMRVAVAFDAIRRFLQALSLRVNFVQNVTDVDDKIIAKAREAGEDWKEWALIHEKQFLDAYDKLNVLPPSHTPHATSYINEQIELIQRIIDAGFAYQGAPGDVWFDTNAFKDYGSLTNQLNDAELEVSEEDLRPEKRNPRDFALWKAVHPKDPTDASWESPWGKGRPGWHIECSAMSVNLLGEKFAIHGGGLDLRFPHHENELAQARAANYGFAKIWMHSAWVTAKGEKMSKTLGNGLNVFAVIENSALDALALRYALVTVHYRSMLEWTPDSLDAARTAIKRIHTYLVQNGGEKYTDDLVQATDVGLFPQFKVAMEDDFNTAKAIAIVHTGIKERIPVLHLRRALDILGVDPLSEKWRNCFDQPSNDFTPDERSQIESLLQRRLEAKKSRDFMTADAIRDELLTSGIALVDTTDGTTYQRV